MVGLQGGQGQGWEATREAPLVLTPLCLQQLEGDLLRNLKSGASLGCHSVTHRTGARGGSLRVRNAHHRPRSRAQRDHTVQKRKQTCQDEVMASKPCRQQATRPPAGSSQTPSTQTSTRGTTWEGTRCTSRGQRHSRSTTRDCSSHPLCPRQSCRCIQQREKSRVGRGERKDVKRSNTQVSPPAQGPGSPAGDSGPLREGPGTR